AGRTGESPPTPGPRVAALRKVAYLGTFFYLGVAIHLALVLGARPSITIAEPWEKDVVATREVLVRGAVLSARRRIHSVRVNGAQALATGEGFASWETPVLLEPNRKSTRLNSSHVKISYAV